MKRFIISVVLVSAFFYGCCCNQKCRKHDDQAHKSKVEANKAFQELDESKNK